MSDTMWKPCLKWGTAAFLFSWLLTSAQQMWAVSHQYDWACQTNLRTLYVAAERLMENQHARHPSELSFKQFLYTGFTPTKSENQYLFGAQSGRPVALLQIHWMLLCAADPQFAVKSVMIKSNALDFAPSYELLPADNTNIVARCPFHHQAINRDGVIVDD